MPDSNRKRADDAGGGGSKRKSRRQRSADDVPACAGGPAPGSAPTTQGGQEAHKQKPAAEVAVDTEEGKENLGMLQDHLSKEGLNQRLRAPPSSHVHAVPCQGEPGHYSIVGQGSALSALPQHGLPVLFAPEQANNSVNIPPLIQQPLTFLPPRLPPPQPSRAQALGGLAQEDFDAFFEDMEEEQQQLIAAVRPTAAPSNSIGVGFASVGDGGGHVPTRCSGSGPGPGCSIPPGQQRDSGGPMAALMRESDGMGLPPQAALAAGGASSFADPMASHLPCGRDEVRYVVAEMLYTGDHELVLRLVSGGGKVCALGYSTCYERADGW